MSRTLQHVDFRDDDENDRRRVEAELATFDGAVPERFEVADPGDAVRLQVRRDGEIEDVAIFRDRLAPNGFAAALGSAYAASVRESLKIRALASLTDVDASLTTPDPSPSPAFSSTESAVADLPTLVERIADETSRLVQEAEHFHEPPRPAERMVIGPAGYVRLTVRNRRIVSITADENRVRSAYPAQLRTDVLTAIRLAQNSNDK